MFTNLSENDVYLNHKDRVSYYQDRVVLDNTCITFTDPTFELHNGSLRPKLQCVIRPLLNTDRFSDRVVPQQLKEEFNLISEAGNGSFATVIKVQEKRTRAIYACKIIKINILSENFLRTAIEREVNVWKNLDHPNIVKFYRYIDFPDTAVYILEFMRGGTLESLYNTTTYITETTRVSYFKQICEGLAYLHRRKVIHRDLKPQNILLTDTVPVVVKIADLGVAKHTEMFESARTVCGTKLYAAPEIFTDTLRNEEGNYNSSADIWSLGLLLVELMHMKCVDITLADNLRTGKADASAISVPEKVRPVVIGTLKMKPSDRMSIVEVLDHQMFNEKLDDRKRKANDTIISSHIDVDIERAMKRTFISQQQETSLCWGKLCLLEDTAYSKEEFALNKSTIFIGDNQTFDVSLPSRYFSDLYCEISRQVISNTICHHNGCPLDQNMPIRLCNGDEHKPICFKFEEIHHTLTPSFLSSQSVNDDTLMNIIA
ncbi:kinase-like domain-containing protein [Syncephalis plumigaleata]|nr:kinase-like domain-containing protein [Syncephalis plumigaleata]